MSRPVIRLATTMPQFEAAHAASDKTRGKSVTLPTLTLTNLLIDHAAMINTLREHGRVEYRGDEDKRDAP